MRDEKPALDRYGDDPCRNCIHRHNGIFSRVKTWGRNALLIAGVLFVLQVTLFRGVF